MTEAAIAPIYFSYSIAAELITKSPAHAYRKHKVLGGKDQEPEEPTAAQLRGTAIHQMILGASAGAGGIVMIDCDNWRKKEHQEARDAAIGDGKTPLTIPQFLDLSTAADAIKANMLGQGLALGAKSEVPLEWEERSTSGIVVKCRGKLDNLIEPAHIIDLKSTSDASPDYCSKQIYSMGYDIQQSAYRSGLRKNRPEFAGRERFTFVFFELKAPYSVTIATLDGDYQHIADQRWQRAVDRWADCLSTNTWPHYANGVVRLAPPGWVSLREDSIVERELQEERA